MANVGNSVCVCVSEWVTSAVMLHLWLSWYSCNVVCVFLTFLIFFNFSLRSGQRWDLVHFIKLFKRSTIIHATVENVFCRVCIYLCCSLMGPLPRLPLSQRCCGRRPGSCGSLQVIRRWHRKTANIRRGASAESALCIWRRFHTGSPRHPLPETGHAGCVTNGGEDRQQILLLWRCWLIER